MSTTTTRCPSCKTRFRVTPAQLEAADGWVRCGHCADIFDAMLALRTETDDTADTPAPDAATAATPDTPEPRRARSARVQRRRQPPEAQDRAPEATPSLTDNAPAAEPEFVRLARRHAFWRRGPVRAGLLALALLLGVGLLLQGVVHERKRLLATDPSLQPVLARLCDALGCDLGPWPQIDALVIDSARLLKREGDHYQLDMVLRNTAPVPVAAPAVELTLTDAREKVLVRKVLTAEQLMPGQPTVPGQGSQNLSPSLTVSLPAGQAMAGYHTLIFYP